MNQDLTLYYKERAKEYDKVYSIPEEQNDLVKATEIFQKLFFQKHVLEIACGTGYWTEQISKSATSIFATDINESVIEIAKSRKIFENVVFEVADMYSLTPKAKYDALFGGFIWSHILLQDLDDFLDKITGFLKPNATVAFIDSKQVEGSSHSIKGISKTDEQGNTYQTRNLENGANHLVLKNFPSQEFLIQKLTKFSKHINYIDLEYYWIVFYKLDHKE
ncbi:putative methyltransferase [Flammeovirgaceae bacterium 311]|nr:putative methyltransferase [Flammeovirgaceae bacterium 311]